MSTPRVKVKVYGLLSLTKRTYLTIQLTGVFFVLGVATWALIRPRAAAIPGQPTFVSGVNFFVDLLPWLSLLGLILVAMETHIVLGKFRREEERQKNLADAQAIALVAASENVSGDAKPDSVLSTQYSVLSTESSGVSSQNSSNPEQLGNSTPTDQ